MFRNLVSSLIEHERVETTHEKAREVGRLAERMISLGKRGDLHARRQALRIVRGREAQSKLFGELAERFASRSGGYTRVLRTRRRIGDAAEMSIVSLLEAAPAAKGAGEKSDKAPGKKAAAAKKASGKKAEQAEKPARKKAGTKKAAAKGTRKKKSSRSED
jgi:large subunit ribosomal protein L17